MDEKKAQEFLEEFNAGLHRIGRITLIVSVILLVGAPFLIGAVNGVMPDLRGFLSGFAKVGIIYIPVAIVEFLVYSPMLGAGGSYLAFITGNVTNMKIPCAINARDIAKTRVGTPENEIISTLSVATSAIVATVDRILIFLFIVFLLTKKFFMFPRRLREFRRRAKTAVSGAPLSRGAPAHVHSICAAYPILNRNFCLRRTPIVLLRIPYPPPLSIV